MMQRDPVVRDVVELAPVTVTRISTGDVHKPPRGAPSPPARRRPARLALLLQVPEAALLAALDLAGGDRSRLRLGEDGSVTIANAPRPGTDPERTR